MKSTIFPAAGALVRSGTVGNFSASFIVPPRGDAEPHMILAMFDPSGNARILGDVLSASPTTVDVRQEWTTLDDQSVGEDYVEAAAFPGFSGIAAVRSYVVQHEEQFNSGTWGGTATQVYRIWHDGLAWGYVVGAMSWGADNSDLSRWNALADLIELSTTGSTTKITSSTPLVFTPQLVREPSLQAVRPQWTRLSRITAFVPYSGTMSHSIPNMMRAISGATSYVSWSGLQVFYRVMHFTAKHEANNWFDAQHEAENWYTAQQNLLKYGWQIVTRADEADPAPLSAMWPMTCDPDVYAAWDADVRSRCQAEAQRLGHQYRSHAAIAEVLSSTSTLLETSAAQSAASLQAAIAGVTEANTRLQAVVSAIATATEGITNTSATATAIATTLQRVNEISDDTKAAAATIHGIVEATAALVQASRVDLATDTATLAQVQQVSGQIAQTITLVQQDLQADLAQLGALSALVTQSSANLEQAISSLQLTAGSESMSAQLQSLRATLMNLGRPIYNLEKGADPDELV